MLSEQTCAVRFTYMSPCSTFHQFKRFPLLRRPLFVSIPFWVVWWASAHYKSPRSWRLLIPRAQRYLAFVSGFPRAFWCSRGKHVRIPFAASRDQIHQRLRFCCDSFFTCIFLCSFRHRFALVDGAEMANVEQTQKMIPLITCEISLGQYVCELFFGGSVFDLDFGVQIDSIEQNQSRATLWVLETCLIVGLLPFMIILITASLSSNTYNKASWWEDWTFEGIKSTLSKSLITLWDCLRLWIVWGGEQTSRLFNNGSHRSMFSVLSRVSKDLNDQIP